MKLKLDVISAFMNALENAYQNMKAAELDQENISMTKELIDRCLERDVFDFYSNIFASETKEVETTDSDNSDADNSTDIKEATEPLDSDDIKWEYRLSGNHHANKRTISPKTFELIDDMIINTDTSADAITALHEKGIDVSYSTVCRRKNLIYGKDKSDSVKSYITKAKIAFNEMKAAGCKEYNGNIYYADGTPVPAILSTNFTKFNVWKSIRIPTKYIVAMYNGYEELNENTNIWNLNEDPRDTRIINLHISVNKSYRHRRHNRIEIENICRIFAEEKGDPLKTWQRCVDELGDFITSAILSNLRTKQKYGDISDNYFTINDVKQWYGERNYLSTINLTPKDNYTGDDTKYAKMLEKYAFTNKEIPLQDKEFILKNFLTQEYGMDRLLFTDATDLKYAIDSIRNKLKDKGINISTSYIRGIININGGGIELGG